MKNLVKHFGTRGRVLCAIVPAAIMIFVLAACANGTTEQNPLVISGTLSGGGPSPSIVSRLSVGGPLRAVVPGATQTFRVELGADNKTLSGKLKDGSITFELTGEYDASTKAFSVQAPSSFMIFSIAGKLNASNIIDTDSTTASVKVKDGVEWTNKDLTIIPSSQTIDSAVDAPMTGVTSIPANCRGIFTDQISGYLKYIVTKNSITMIDGSNVVDFTVVEITGSGPWDLIIVGKWYEGAAPLDYTGKFYVSTTFDSKLTSAIGDATVSDVTWGWGGNDTLSTAVTQPQLSGIKMFVAPYCGNTSVSTDGVYPHDADSPLFTGASATANAKAATALKAKSGFVLALK